MNLRKLYGMHGDTKNYVSDNGSVVRVIKLEFGKAICEIIKSSERHQHYKDCKYAEIDSKSDKWKVLEEPIAHYRAILKSERYERYELSNTLYNENELNSIVSILRADSLHGTGSRFGKREFIKFDTDNPIMLMPLD